MRSFRLETSIDASASACFELSLSVDAHSASMSSAGEEAIDGVTSGVMTLGDTVTWRARHFGIWFEMTSAITDYSPPHRFVDEQQRGPFHTWWHEHSFHELARTQTLMVDEIRYQAPLGPLGAAAEFMILSRYMPHLVRQRNSWLKSELEQ